MDNLTHDTTCRPRRYVLINTAEEAILGNDEEMLRGKPECDCPYTGKEAPEVDRPEQLKQLDGQLPLSLVDYGLDWGIHKGDFVLDIDRFTITLKRDGTWEMKQTPEREPSHRTGCVCADCSAAELTAAND